MNDNHHNNDKNYSSVHFINGDQLKCEFMQSNRSTTTSDDEQNQSIDQIDHPIDYHSNDQQKLANNNNDKGSPTHPFNNQRRSNESSPKPPVQLNDELESSTFCTINPPSTDRGIIETDGHANSVFMNRNAESYDFAIPLPFSQYRAPPKRSEISSFIHSPFSKTLDTFSKLSNYLKDDPDDRPDDFFLRRSTRYNDKSNGNNNNNNICQDNSPQQFPPPSLPEIEAKSPKTRQQPVTEHEYDTELKFKSKIFVLERIFLGGLESDSLRRRLWPILLGVVDSDDEENWIEKKELYNLFMQQWKSITPDQESRFTAFKEKKSMAERDVVRCDRCHPYFKNEENIEILKDILMCYIMYDFDTGYVQGMSDLCAPLLYVFEGDPVKTFWCFTGVLNLTKKNFEMSQITIKNLLIKLFKLVNLTDPCFAEFLADNESDNCYFAFRWLICLFKREFVKADNNYGQLLLVWDSLWSVHAYEKARQEEAEEEFSRQLKMLKENNNEQQSTTIATTNVNNETTSDLASSFSNKLDLDTTLGTSPPYIVPSFVENKGGDFDGDLSNTTSNNNGSVSQKNNNKSSDSEQNETTNQLTNFELLLLSISLAIIRQERDLIFTQKLDASGIIKHFNSLDLSNYLNETLRHATQIWCWLKDEGEAQLYDENICSKDGEWRSEGYDLLND